MKKLFKSYIAMWAILVVAFNLIVFIAPNLINFDGVEYTKFGGAFWSGYIFIMLAFIGQFVASYVFFKEENKDKVFLNMPIYTLSKTALVVAVIFGTIFMVVPDLPNAVGAVIGIVILALYAVAIIKASFAADVVEEVGNKVKAQTQFIKMTTVNAENILNRAKSDAVKAECKKVYEALRYSDPMSSDALTLVEAQITVKIGELASAVGEDNIDTVTATADEILLLVKERNSLCKVMK